MKKLTQVMVTLAVLFAGTACADSFYGPHGNNVGRAETDSNGNTRYYDRSGRYIGRAEKSGSNVRYYDSRGAYAGRAETSGGNTRYYDSRGSYSGRAEQSGSNTRYYDSKGSYAGQKNR